MPDEPHHTAKTGSESRSSESAEAAPSLDRASAKSPLITAVEIENFKGIGGRRVRIDLRPITLLFGRNSAGKSTVLHALCYAHEILSRGNVDAGQTDLGGAQIDLGGFRHFVHAHDRERAVRLRFEMNLEDWEVPGPLVDNMQPRVRDSGPNEGMDADRAAGFAAWIRTQAKAESVRSGWVEIAVQWSPWPKDEPVLASYEVGVNGVLFGRVARVGDSDSNFDLEFDWKHPSFDPLGPTHPPGATGDHVRDAPDPGADARRLHRVRVRGAAPLPVWNRPLSLIDDDFNARFARSRSATKAGVDHGEIPVPGFISWSLPRFEALVSAFLVGIGRTLRDELAALRYIGPARKLRPRTEVEPGSHDRGSWSDGSAAWNLLVHRDPDPQTREDLLDDVNRWLENSDRLDTGYKLARKSTVQLPEVTPGVPLITFLARLPAEYRNGNGDVDMDHWARKQAEQLADHHGYDPDDVEARIKNRRRDKNGLDQSDVTDKIVESCRKIYQIIADDVVAVARIEKGGPVTKALVQAIASAPLRTTLELVTAGSELPVRTSDVGVGISQVLPVVTAVVDPDRPGITAVEQPELHLHPRMQVELGDLFAQSVDQGGVFLLENHSEHLMLRLLRRIEETHGGELPEGKPALKPDQVSVVYLDRVDGEVTATRLRIDEEGEFIDRWPHGFFDERAKELF